MPDDVRVHINDATVISALNTPGGDVAEWRNEVEMDILTRVFIDSPVNDPLDAMHRGGVTGEFQASWVTYRWGNGHRIGFNIENFAPHAIFVEEGRSGSTKYQRFSWTRWGGEIREVGGLHGGGTGPREGKHILRDTVNRVLEVATGGSYAPLV